MERYNSVYESKQIGVLYHFTEIAYVEKIINDNFILKSSSSTNIKNLNDKFEESIVSFTRNFNFENGDIPIRFDIDGTKLSEQYKISPYSYNLDNDEMEERIESNEVDINKSLLSITIKSQNYYRILPVKLYESLEISIRKLSILEKTLHNWVPELYNIFDENLDTIINKIPIYIVNDFKPYNWLNTRVN
jgi:hypothetical protein